MDNLRWWLLLIAAVMFSMSGCASSDWAVRRDHPTHFASSDHRAADLSGHWVGSWKGLGLFDALRQNRVEATLVQQGSIGVAHLVLDDTIAAGVPWIMRVQGAQGVRLVYRVSGEEAVMRHPAQPSEMMAAFTLIGNRLVGTLPNADAPVVITLSRLDK